jgi:uncharacterized membrane protein HdeD (DUF308 family)
MLRTMCGRWWVLLLRGLCAIGLGIMAIVWPGVTLVSMVFAFGIFAVIDGVLAIILGFKGEEDGTVWWTLVVMGVLAVLAGVIAFVQPGIALAMFLALVAAYAIVRGIFEIIAAIRLRKEIDDEWLLAISGIASLVFGGLILYRPQEGLIAIAILLGAFLLAIGVLAVALSLRLRRLQHKLAAT